MLKKPDALDPCQYQGSFLEFIEHYNKNTGLLSRNHIKQLTESLLRAALQADTQNKIPSYTPQHVLLQNSMVINLVEIADKPSININQHNNDDNALKWQSVGSLIEALLPLTLDTDMNELLQDVVSTLLQHGIEEALSHLNHTYKLQELTRRYKYVDKSSINSNPSSTEKKSNIKCVLLMEADFRMQLIMARLHFDSQQIDFYRYLCNKRSSEEQLQLLFNDLVKQRDSDMLFVLLMYSYERDICLHCLDLSLDTPTLQPKTPLLKAVENDSREDIIKYLNFSRCSCREVICLTLNLKTSYFAKHVTALMLAAWKGNIQVARHLLTELGMQTEDGRTALMLAAWKGNYEVMRLLLPEAGMVDKKGKTALMYAASSGNLLCVKMLLGMEAGRQRWWDGSTALIYAAKNNWPNVVGILATAEARLQTGDGMTALMIAAQNNYLEVIKKLSQVEACMQDDYGKTALMEAAIRGHTDACRLLLPFEKRMQNTIDETSLILAVQNNHLDCVFLLIDEEAGFQDLDGHSALMWAAKYGHSELIKLLKHKEGALKDGYGRTALYYAEHPYWRVSKYNRDACIALLKH